VGQDTLETRLGDPDPEDLDHLLRVEAATALFDVRTDVKGVLKVDILRGVQTVGVHQVVGAAVGGRVAAGGLGDCVRPQKQQEYRGLSPFCHSNISLIIKRRSAA